MPETTRSTIQDLLPQTTDSVEATMALGARIVNMLAPGAVLALYGDLGSGKTHFAKGVARGLGLRPAEVRSPTFTILSVHEEGKHPLYHFDAYRVQTPDEFVELGFETYVHGEGITCIEWAGRVAPLLPPDTVHLQFHHVAPSRRRVTLGAPDASDDETPQA
ncbi:tRNA (adenosine(37)-N6)-threonylcarbamoyltransferase complex ATPase subunit type 1 TsaE [Salinibacter altiplanensis]|uniref:tRNA (adenosine(37)-N6)-threonylcarbamoyltransferase complex ATPase subunit type 1 TsaE n=1 Tax=Salinibacter altiplanensis TaxID=1803181 RepID=UPI000C9ED760|nr:tRNA (adenosine(37)-N6)-threonylcarbamoyltransferase complex ATPase subunit type 1 TsaE [Salinibacter altiplanensis]